MRNVIRYIIWTVLSPILRGRPLQDWPSWGGRLFEVKIPSTVTAQMPAAPSGGANINVILKLLRQTEKVHGAVAECGVYRGGTLLAMGLYMKERKLSKTVYGYDSFEGFDSTIAVDLSMGGSNDSEKREGGFSGTSAEYVGQRIKLLGLENVVRLVPGFFRDTLGSVPEQNYSLVHLDCDIYESYRACLNYFYPRMSPGGVILLDEYNDPPWPGCNRAVDEFLADKSETLKPIECDGFLKYSIEFKGTPRVPEV